MSCPPRCCTTLLEDTPVSSDELAERFGPRVAELVGWVTIPETGPGEDRAEVKQASLRGLAAAPRDAVLVKLADRLSNVQTLRNLGEDRQRSYYAQTVRLHRAARGRRPVVRGLVPRLAGRARRPRRVGLGELAPACTLRRAGLVAR